MHRPAMDPDSAEYANDDPTLGEDPQDYKALRVQQQRAQVARHRAALIAAWRAAHPQATCSDETVVALVAIEAVGRRRE